MDGLLNIMFCLVKEALPVLVGAALAFYFGFELYKKQKREEHKSYTHYATSVLSYLNNHLYGFKKQIAKLRYDEAISIQKKIEECPQNGDVLNLEFKHTVNYWWR
jgi:hypothetical protein